jgi:hypothetical protein
MTTVRAAFAGILTLCLLNGEASKAGTIYDAAADFSSTNNPNGVWTYGWSSTLGSAFNLDVSRINDSGIDFWEGAISTGSPPGQFPYVSHNGTSSTITYGGTVLYNPGQLGMHPGPQGQYSVIRFTAPAAGPYQLASSFAGLDFIGPTTTDVHVLLDGSAIFNGNVDGFGAGSGPSFTTTFTLQKGDTVDFAVGFGTNGTYFNDSTGITATFILIPEPTSFVLLSMGLVGLGVLAANRGIRRE